MKRIPPNTIAYGTAIALATAAIVVLIRPEQEPRLNRALSSYRTPFTEQNTRYINMPVPVISSISVVSKPIKTEQEQLENIVRENPAEQPRTSAQPAYDIAIETSQRQSTCSLQAVLDRLNHGDYSTPAFGQEDGRLGLALYYFGRIKTTIDDINTCRTTPSPEKRSLLSSISNEALRTIEKITNEDARIGVVLHLQQQVTDEIPRAQNNSSLNSLVAIRTDLTTLGAHVNADQLSPNNCLSYINQIHSLPNDAKTSWYNIFLRAKQKAIDHHIRAWSGLANGPVSGNLMDIYHVQFYKQ